ncbi:hypothetical protein [Paraburkholderia phytofirmans]|uniref:hypothetical protein n=1 Tax=Paraburkholderia phytofirmans TaxID=261302 RepID=UPI0038BC244D
MNRETSVDALYETLCQQTTNPRQRASLKRIKQACDYLEQNGLKISPTTIERYCIDHQWEGPKAQSIRNSRDVLNKYVQLRQAGQQVFAPNPRHDYKPAIQDETLRAYVALLQQERDQAIAARNRIEAALRTIPGVPIDDFIRTGIVTTATAKPSSGHRTTPWTSTDLKSALLVLLDEAHLVKCGLQLYKDRVRAIGTKMVLLEKPQVTAIRAVIEEAAEKVTES